MTDMVGAEAAIQEPVTDNRSVLRQVEPSIFIGRGWMLHKRLHAEIQADRPHARRKKQHERLEKLSQNQHCAQCLEKEAMLRIPQLARV